MENLQHTLHKIAKEYRPKHVAEVFMEHLWNIEDEYGNRVFEYYTGEGVAKAENAIILKEDSEDVVILDEKGFVRTLSKLNNH
jgi:hypothetical protein